MQSTLRVLIPQTQLVVRGDLHFQGLTQGFYLCVQSGFVVDVLLERSLLVRFLLADFAGQRFDLLLIVKDLIEQNSVGWQCFFLGLLDLFSKGRDLGILLGGLELNVVFCLLEV